METKLPFIIFAAFFILSLIGFVIYSKKQDDEEEEENADSEE